MSTLNYPVGMSDFPEIIEENYMYVDKTRYIKSLISNGKFKFLSRPRRFGKTLLLSTLHAYFDGRRELFKGLAADSMDLDWTPSPVLHFNFNTGKYNDPIGLENRLTAHLEKFERKYGIPPRPDYDNALRFENIIEAVYEKTGRKVVILVDEYDKPLLDIEDDKELFEKHQRTLKSGTPAFLARRVRKRGTFPPDLNGRKCAKEDLTAVGLNDRDPVPLMFQTGYLTIGCVREDSRLYELRFPNREVEIGFYRQLLPFYVPDAKDSDTPFDIRLFRTDLAEGRPEDFMERLATLLRNLPLEDHNESAYRAITFLISYLAGIYAIAEHHGYKGRTDLEVFAARNIYIFEFKYNKSVHEAMDQIHSRDYAGRYAMDSRKVWLIGANFIEDKDHRALEYEITTINEI